MSYSFLQSSEHSNVEIPWEVACSQYKDILSLLYNAVHLNQQLGFHSSAPFVLGCVNSTLTSRPTPLAHNAVYLINEDSGRLIESSQLE